MVNMVINMNKQERQQQIINYIHEVGEVQTPTLCRKFHIVAMTARRDLSELEAQGVIVRTHGGAIAKEKKTFDTQTPLLLRLKLNHEQKENIAELAKKMLQPHDCVFIASGSTIDIFSKKLIHYLPLTVVSDAVNIAYHLNQDPHLHIYLVGGELRNNSFTLTGSIAETNVKQFRLTKAFISVNGIDEEGNLYTSSVVESGLLEVLFKNVENIYVLCDSSKLGNKDFIKISHLPSYTLITDSNADIHLLKSYTKKGIVVHQTAGQFLIKK